MRKFWGWLSLSGLVIVIDQITKQWVAGALPLYSKTTVTSYFDLVFVYNPGAAFSFLASHPQIARWFFTTLALVISAWLITLVKHHARETLQPLALSLIIGGALGNAIDRIFVGQVIDFLSFHIGEHAWPAFNAADSAITLGVILMILAQLRGQRTLEKS